MKDQPPSSITDNQSELLLLVTGGTLDKNYNALSGELEFSSTHAPQMLSQANASLHSVQTLMLKDSLDMTQADRKTIAEACIKALQQKIVITHGTDTMTDTAHYLKACPELADKVIVLTGAMRPFMLGDSDASFNLGTAIMAANLSENGVYITMNGIRFEADDVCKNKSLGIFERLRR
ncbi:asparaginase domain-containing protein [Hydrogenovibrio marinus]|uniref:Asparaginase n=1 Tax=Hydrogenovibrio marinus TaxID=28885 RepID=A0A066ZYM7_HYDMR|nr:asparaginase domain-containing protein [Hydrogenovibrio marinus]KDN95170.1 asparaginase [Hydrogenovibrio marinus]BBN59645.1 asparaginase [Hydrogenovibrio marinus]